VVVPKTSRELLPGTLKNLFYPPERGEYEYFSRARDCPFPAGSAITKAAWAADAAMLSYARYGPNRMTTADLAENFQRGGLTCVTFGGTPGNWNAGGTQGVFAECGEFAIVAFRGTERDDPRDLFYDADLVLVPEHDHRPVAGEPGPALGHFAAIAHLFSLPCLAHRGFQQALGEVWDRVHELVTGYRTRHPRAEIVFTGHSLGAALAVLAYSRFADPDLSLYTFGCPRVGDGAFCARVLSNPGRGQYRYVNYNDAVAHIPLESGLYRHSPSQCYRFADDGRLGPDEGLFQGDIASLRAAVVGLPRTIEESDLDNILAPPSLVDHSPARYCFRLWDCV
jgi:hypothetical protein